MKLTVGTKLGIGFGLALLILVIIGIAAYQSIQNLTATTELVARTQRGIAKLEVLISTIKDAETGQRGYLLTGEERYLEPYQSAKDSLGTHLKELREITKANENHQRRINLLEPLLMGKEGKLAELQDTIDARKDPARGPEVATQIVRTDQGKRVMDEIRRIITEMEDEAHTLLKERSEDSAVTARNASMTIIVGTLVAFLFVAIGGYIITGNIANPLKQMAANAEKIAVGDLNAEMPSINRSDEVGVLSQTFVRMTDALKGMAETATSIAGGDLSVKVQPISSRDLLGNAFATMAKNLQRMIADLGEGINVLGTAATEISASTTQLAASATESATAVSETTTTVEEVRQTAQMASQKAKFVSETAQKAAQTSVSGRKSTEDVAAGMSRIRQQMDGVAASMGRLSEQGSAIGQIIATVEDLAAQSNLLAVNAAIEAAKAGEHGKGFSVVAQEVKSLADQSRQATTQVRNILSDIQKATTAAVLATEQGIKAVEAGTRQTEVAAESIQFLTGSVNEAAQSATQIAASSQQQLVGVDQVASAMESIKQASAQNVASAKQLETAAHNLSGLGQRLKQMIERYKV